MFYTCIKFVLAYTSSMMMILDESMNRLFVYIIFCLVPMTPGALALSVSLRGSRPRFADRSLLPLGSSFLLCSACLAAVCAGLAVLCLCLAFAVPAWLRCVLSWLVVWWWKASVEGASKNPRPRFVDCQFLWIVF